MTNRDRNLLKWQEELRVQPKIYAVEIFEPEVGYINTNNFYHTKEAAQLEVDFLIRKEGGRVKVVSYSIHTDDLSKRRWVDGL